MPMTLLDAALREQAVAAHIKERAELRTQAHTLSRRIIVLRVAIHRKTEKAAPDDCTAETEELNTLLEKRAVIWRRVSTLTREISSFRKSRRRTPNVAHPAPHAQAQPEHKPAEPLPPHPWDEELDDVLG